MKLYGAIDIGTNAARLLIGQVEITKDYQYVKKISYTRVPLRLGVEVFENGEISKKKEKELIKTMKAFSLLAEVYGVEEIQACATSAMREAKNGSDIVKAVKKEAGLRIEVIDGDHEGKLIFESFAYLRKTTPHFIIIDVGGGSTEVSLFHKGQRAATKSFQIGTIRLLKDKVKSGIWNEIFKWMDKHLPKSDEFVVYGTGGNINKTHKLLGKLKGQPVTFDELSDLYNDMASMSLDKRTIHYQLKDDRADVIVPALSIYVRILHHLGEHDIYVPKIGLSDGMIHHMHND